MEFSRELRNDVLPGDITLSRLEDRRSIREAMDRLRRDTDPALRDLDAYYGRAFDMLTGKAVAAAFDIAAEKVDGPMSTNRWPL